MEIREEKIWIQRNQTDTLIADKLIAKGVAKDDIILGLQPPYVRELDLGLVKQKCVDVEQLAFGWLSVKLTS